MKYDKGLSYRHMMGLSCFLLDERQFDIFASLHWDPLIEDSHLDSLLNHSLLHNDDKAADFLIDQLKSPISYDFKEKHLEMALREHHIENMIYLINKFDDPEHTSSVFSELAMDEDENGERYSYRDVNYIMSSYTGSKLSKKDLFMILPLLEDIDLTFDELSVIVPSDVAQEIVCDRDSALKRTITRPIRGISHEV